MGFEKWGLVGYALSDRVYKGRALGLGHFLVGGRLFVLARGGASLDLAGGVCGF